MVVPSQPWSLGDSAPNSGQRDGLVRFWLAAPADQLDALWNSGFGITSRKLIEALTPSHTFTPEQVQTRNNIAHSIDLLGLQHPLATQLMLANFLLSPPGLITINNVEAYFPTWFVDAYRSLYDLDSSSAKLPDVLPQSSEVGLQEDHLPPSPEIGPFPSSLHELVSNRLHLNRLLGLANLYYIDPEDREICSELLQLRRNLVDIINSCPENQLEQIWSTELGERYWALVRSGVQKEPLETEDLSRKENAVAALNPQLGAGFRSPGAVNAFLIVMLYFVPGSMKVDAPDDKLPAWLLPAYREIFAKAISM